MAAESVPISASMSSYVVPLFAAALFRSTIEITVRVIQVAALLTIALVCVVGDQEVAPSQESTGDLLRLNQAASVCQSRKIGAVASNVRGILGCYANAAATTHPVDGECLAAQRATLINAFADIEKRGGCATVADEPMIEQSVHNFALRVAALVPRTGGAGEIQLRAIGAAVDSLFTAYARQRRAWNDEQISAAEYALRTKLVPGCGGATLSCDRQGAFEAIFTLTGEIIGKLWPMSAIGVSFALPPGFAFEAWSSVLSGRPHLIRLVNFDPTGLQGFIPPGGAEFAILFEQAPQEELANYITEQTAMGTPVSQSLIEVDHVVGTEVLYKNEDEPGVQACDRQRIAYVVHGDRLWRFSVLYGCDDSNESAFNAAFERLLASARFSHQRGDTAIASPEKPHAYRIPNGSRWKSFTNRAGWTVKYPPGWTVGSCGSCSDPTDPIGFVSLSSPARRHGGFITIEHLRDMPPTADVWDWLHDVSAYPISRLTEERTVVDGRPALRVRHRHVDGTERETLFIVDSSRTFTVSFSGKVRGSIEKDPFYAVHRQIVSTFAFTSGNER